MKVYVDGKLPKSCEKCEFYERETELVGEWGMENHRHICKINGSLIQGICPLQSLADYTKQVIEGVVEDFYDEIRHRAILEDDYCPDHNLERKYGVRKCLLENIRSAILKKYGGENESK